MKKDIKFAISVIIVALIGAVVFVWSMGAAFALDKKPEPKIVITNTACGNAIIPALAMMMNAGVQAEAEKSTIDSEWYATVVGGNLAIVDTFAKEIPKGKAVPAVFAWKVLRSFVLYALSHMDFIPGGKSAGSFLKVINLVTKAETICAEEEHAIKTPKAPESGVSL